MQQRFHRAWASSFEEAVEVKNIFKAENPDGKYQIRKKVNAFEIVIRLPSDKAKDAFNPTKRRRKRKRNVYQGSLNEN